MKTIYDWSLIPEDVIYVATDEDGSVTGFCSNLPVIDAKRDCIYIKKYYEDTIINLNIESYKGNWKESLEKRPD